MFHRFISHSLLANSREPNHTHVSMYTIYLSVNHRTSTMHESLVEGETFERGKW